VEVVILQGNHSQAWHNAKAGITAAKRKHADAVSEYSSDSKRRYKIKDAATEVSAAEHAFDLIDRDPKLAFD
jgi:hypothetical protein